MEHVAHVCIISVYTQQEAKVRSGSSNVWKRGVSGPVGRAQKNQITCEYSVYEFTRYYEYVLYSSAIFCCCEKGVASFEGCVIVCCVGIAAQ